MLIYATADPLTEYIVASQAAILLYSLLLDIVIHANANSYEILALQLMMSSSSVKK